MATAGVALTASCDSKIGPEYPDVVGDYWWHGSGAVFGDGKYGVSSELDTMAIHATTAQLMSERGLWLRGGCKNQRPCRRIREEKACASAIGPVSMEELDLEYWQEASEAASGSAAFAASSRVTVGGCEGNVVILLQTREEQSGDLQILDTMTVTYGGSTDQNCPPYCDARYAVEVEAQ